MNKQSHSLDAVLEAFTGEYYTTPNSIPLYTPWKAYNPSGGLLSLTARLTIPHCLPSLRWCQGNERLPIPRQYHRGGLSFSLEGLLSLRRGLLSLAALGLGFPRANPLPIPQGWLVPLTGGLTIPRGYIIIPRACTH